MPRINPHRPYTPDPAQMALAPAITGNTINGLAEGQTRRPDMVYWAPDPDAIAHGKMQRWFYTTRPDDDRFATMAAWRDAIYASPLPEITGAPTDRTPQAWTKALDAFITNGACDKIGVAAMDQNWAYQGHSVPQSRVIVLGVQHAYDAIATAPDHTAALEVLRQYGRAAKAAKDITAWLRLQGWAAEPVTGPMTGTITLIPPALACGFGELGKHGSLITPDFGSSFRLSAVLTDAPFAVTPQQSHGIDDFCTNCRICEDACPPEAIAPEKQTVRGVEKWYVDFDKCLPYFNENQGCAICIAVCPWSRPGIGLNLAAKLERRANR
jgi:Pyruvate/2-oxoacid:ferredoxin oxidoreductase delta subunit